ncbi:MAG: choice-of-anchor D domain-containing protein [Deltaproteobacteria bacterium]|nr:choice-of-anchor D domain-containing protein [Deltaproteobacteria bacterium]
MYRLNRVSLPSALLIASCFPICFPIWACDDAGSGLGQLEGKIELETLVDFGDVQVGMTVPRALEVKNTGTAAVRVQKIERGSGFTASDYEFSVPEGGFALGPNQSQALSVSFRAFSIMEAPVESSFTLTTDVPATPQLTVNLRGRGVRSGLMITPDPADFGQVLVGTDAELEVELRNLLSIAVPVVTRLDGAGAPVVSNNGRGRFELVSDFDPATGSLVEGLLEPQASIRATLRYVPDPAGSAEADEGRWLIANCEDPLCDRPLTLLGRGSNAAIACTPEAIHFGDVNPGSVITRSITCRNATNESVSISGWGPGAGTPAEFTVRPYTGSPNAVVPGQEFTVEADFAPTVASVGRVLRGSIQIRGRNPRANRDLSPAVIGLEGAAGGPDIDVSPMTLTFGRVALGTSAKRRLIVQNSGYSDLEVTAIDEVSGSSAFTLDRTAFVVPSSELEVVEVTFTPAVLGITTGSLVVRSSDGDEPEVRVAVEGEGADLPPCDYVVSPDPMNFGLVQVLHATTQGLRISNVGATDCVLQNFEILAGSSPAFKLAEGPLAELTIPAGESHRVVVEYVPPTAAIHEGVLDFYAPSVTRPNARVGMRGVGSTSSLLISPNELAFGVVGPGCATRDRPIAIYNTGSTGTAVVRVELGPQTSDEFELVGLPSTVPSPPGAGATIAAGQSIEISVRYRARDLGPDAGTIHIFERARAEPYVIPLYGEASANPVNEDLYEQLETPEVDVLFVIDNSGSMTEEQDSLTSNFVSFIQFADAQALDYRIAVVSTDVEDEFPGNGCPSPLLPMRPGSNSQGACGYFADGSSDGVHDPDWRLVTPDEQPSPAAAFSHLAHQGTDGSGNEQGLQAAYQALSSPLTTGWNAGFLRPDAYLALIFVSDEEDSSPSSVDFYANYFRSIKGFRNNNLFSASAIVADAPGGCNGNDPGSRYIALADMTGGIFESICTADWARALQNLGLSVFGYKSRFFLTNQPVAGTVEVFVDGVQVADRAPSGQVRWTYDRASNSINFQPLAIPEPGTQIAIRYSAECL